MLTKIDKGYNRGSWKLTMVLEVEAVSALSCLCPDRLYALDQSPGQSAADEKLTRWNNGRSELFLKLFLQPTCFCESTVSINTDSSFHNTFMHKTYKIGTTTTTASTRLCPLFRVSVPLVFTPTNTDLVFISSFAEDRSLHVKAKVLVCHPGFSLLTF